MIVYFLDIFGHETFTYYEDEDEIVTDDLIPHRVNGPAVIWQDGHQEWYQNGYRHRADGPATIFVDGSESWWYQGQRHREDGPAAIDVGNVEAWYYRGKLHRTDGPAIIHLYNNPRPPEWVIHGKYVSSSKQFQKMTGCSDEYLSMLLLKYGEIK